MKIITEKIHLVFAPGPGEMLKERLQQKGFQVFHDVNILLFAAGVDHLNSTTALIQGDTPGITEDEIVDAVQKIRLHRPAMRMIFIHSSLKQSLIARLVSLGVYDHHVVDDFDEEDVLSWINLPMTYADAFALLSGMNPPQVLPDLPKTPISTLQEKVDEEKKESKKRESKKKENEKEKKKEKKKKEGAKKENIMRSLINILFPPRKKIEETIQEDMFDVYFETSSQQKNDDQEIPKKFDPYDSRIGKGTIIALYSGTKGSTGKTTLAMALAAALQDKKVSVALVDADRSSLGASITLFGSPIVQSKKSRMLHGASLYPPEVLDVGLPNADFVILDFGAVLSARDREIISKADLVLVVSLPETTTVSIIRRHLQNDHLKNARLIVNRVIPGEGLPPWDVAKTMNLPLLATIPYDLQSIENANLRKVSIFDVPGTKFKEPVSQIAERILLERKGEVLK